MIEFLPQSFAFIGEAKCIVVLDNPIPIELRAVTVHQPFYVALVLRPAFGIVGDSVNFETDNILWLRRF